MTEQAKPTPGPYTMNAEATGFYASKAEPYILMAPLSRSDEERRANAALAFQAFNVHHETGLTPRQLAEQRAELLEALQTCVTALDVSRDGGKFPDFDAWESAARAAIAKAQGGRS